MKRLILSFVIAALFAPAIASARIYIPVDQPSDEKFPIAVTKLKGGDVGEQISDIIANDMKLSGYFEVLPEDLYKSVASDEGSSIENIKFSYWTAIGAQALVKGEVSSASGGVQVTLRLFDPNLREMLVGKQYKADKKDIRKVAHRFSDEIMMALTGMRGIFNTRIAYTVASSKKSKEIFVMDMDGYNAGAVTKNKSINISPSWSPDGSRVAFTSYIKGFPEIYSASTGGGGLKKLTDCKCANITPSWSPDGGRIAYSSSESGIANLYVMSSSGGSSRRITQSGVIDVSPSWSPGADQIVFSSERAGGLHVYTTSSGGGGVNRLTFVGYQNDMPDWSPMGDKIAFAGRDMGTFDIFIMNPDGSNIQRLTVAAGSNENPSFSPDGRYIAFSSTREGGEAIYIMRSDGSNQMRVSKGNGLLPDWGPQSAE
jgi:TolB protein